MKVYKTHLILLVVFGQGKQTSVYLPLSIYNRTYRYLGSAR